MTDGTPTNMIQFLEFVGRLKHIKRTGWVLRNVQQPETIAGHMYRMAIITFLLDGKDNISKSRCMELALVHDLAECIVGDITPYCGVDLDEKHRREDEAMIELAKLAGPNGNYLYDLYKEYESQKTPESQLVKELDRFDMVMQAFEYEKRNESPNTLQEFFDSTAGKFKHPLITSLVSEINSQRSALEQKN